MTRRRCLTGLLVAAVLIGALYGRALFEARAALNEGETWLPASEERAVTAFRHAVSWYAPLNPYSRAAADRLETLGLAPTDDAASRERALLALESLRTGILVARSFYTPYEGRLPGVESRIAELRGAQAAARTGLPLADEVTRQLELLRASRERAPHPIWSLLATIGFVAWLGLTFRGLSTAFDADGRLRRRRAAVFAGGSALCLAAWLVGLTLV